MSLGVIGLCVITAIAGIAAVRDEMAVAQAQARLLADGQNSSAEAETLSPVDVDLPPRAQVIEAVRLANAASREIDAGARASGLHAAEAALRSVERRRPSWGDARIARAYVTAQSRGPDSPEATAALKESYASMPFARDAGGWRIATGLAAWQRLDDASRGYVVDEAAWLAQTSYRSMLGVTALIRGTPAYEPFMLRWRALRMADATI